MKKIAIILSSFLTFSAFSSNNSTNNLILPTYVKIIKSGGGLFGYKYVNTTTTSNGSGGTNSILACSNPGFTGCRSRNAELVLNGLTEEDMLKIDEIVSEKILSNKNDNTQNGQFIYNNTHVVVFEFKLNPNKLTTEIYTIQEAKDNGINF